MGGPEVLVHYGDFKGTLGFIRFLGDCGVARYLFIMEMSMEHYDLLCFSGLVGPEVLVYYENIKETLDFTRFLAISGSRGTHFR